MNSAKARHFLLVSPLRALNFSVDIRQNILTGRIDEATVLLNKHFPSVLADPMEVDSGSTPSSGRLEYLPSTSVEPSHLAINLRIQAFIETARRIPLLYYPPGSSTALDPPPLLWGTPDESACDGDEDACEHWEDNEANTQLLHRAQSLYSEANQLPDKNDRGMYLAELSSVGGILAYRFPEKSPLADYMSQERREGIANQIDSAILCSYLPACDRLSLPLTSVLHRPCEAASYLAYRTLCSSYKHRVGYAARKRYQGAPTVRMAHGGGFASFSHPFSRTEGYLVQRHRESRKCHPKSQEGDHGQGSRRGTFPIPLANLEDHSPKCSRSYHDSTFICSWSPRSGGSP